MAEPSLRTLLAAHPVLAILRGVPARHAPHLADALYRAGIRMLEVALSDELGLEALKAVQRAHPGAFTLGAGTVVTLERARAAQEAGATFLLTPHLVPEVNVYAVQHGLGLISGAMTPTEIMAARAQGSEVVKLFPAGPLGPAYLRDLLGPYPDLALLAVGGVSARNAAEFMQAGAVGVGVGSYLTATDWNTPDFTLLGQRAAELLATLRNA
ncbi:bifunctional 4-hydroxy-2-oxoglutarate aldolase/2-dehydro-3-deoxy-phosphogluconate aldolase (plasmid) [Deinococcus sp. KNUC1210]|uniref:bifunctional 4-hydroxy-2-oxoglutarate aldolase/2-dehydro-3-deoxy-phosphogluconate aldolase n=1 Tax=Deinococcus sp. KNUC1210 TaxID=2917691 RepID=UPI001EEF92F6|nr:bifunctional 4-hydroxy-2-oxoglutarate aldolase/2-dehydro-3-deoxy-phosphogluconate aldolase [Deinococcus sp. KNUC1210]ULH17257.1 bifunctional 4-hydroxy-2-oxoglutarate aldolase/2-dehydro-3-deoxy-phosphogluconate aldolase [Deinococcus sp. KNUC1210]